MNDRDAYRKEQAKISKPSHKPFKDLGAVSRVILVRSLCYFCEIVAIVLFCVILWSRPISTRSDNSSKPGPIIRTTILINGDPVAVSLPRSSIKATEPTDHIYLTNSEYFGVCIVWIIASLTFIYIMKTNPLNCISCKNRYINKNKDKERMD